MGTLNTDLLPWEDVKDLVPLTENNRSWNPRGIFPPIYKRKGELLCRECMSRWPEGVSNCPGCGMKADPPRPPSK